MCIRIPVSICATAKAAGRQYTKRMLPDFLIPYARMRLDRILEAAREKERGADLERCSQIIGCIDLNTVRCHFRHLKKAATQVALELAELQAAMPHLIDHNKELRPLSALKRLEELYRCEEEACRRAGRSGPRLPSLRQLLQAALWKNPGKVSTSCPSRSPPEHDIPAEKDSGGKDARD